MDNNWFSKTDSDSGLLTKKFYNSIEDFPSHDNVFENQLLSINYLSILTKIVVSVVDDKGKGCANFPTANS